MRECARAAFEKDNKVKTKKRELSDLKEIEEEDVHIAHAIRHVFGSLDDKTTDAP